MATEKNNKPVTPFLQGEKDKDELAHEQGNTEPDLQKEQDMDELSHDVLPEATPGSTADVDDLIHQPQQGEDPEHDRR